MNANCFRVLLSKMGLDTPYWPTHAAPSYVWATHFKSSIPFTTNWSSVAVHTDVASKLLNPVRDLHKNPWNVSHTDRQLFSFSIPGFVSHKGIHLWLPHLTYNSCRYLWTTLYHFILTSSWKKGGVWRRSVHFQERVKHFQKIHTCQKCSFIVAVNTALRQTSSRALPANHTVFMWLCGFMFIEQAQCLSPIFSPHQSKIRLVLNFCQTPYNYSKMQHSLQESIPVSSSSGTSYTKRLSSVCQTYFVGTEAA